MGISGKDALQRWEKIAKSKHGISVAILILSTKTKRKLRDYFNLKAMKTAPSQSKS